MNRDEIKAAIDQLQQSGRGQKALQAIHAFLIDGGASLDIHNQQAVATLLSAAWGPKCGTALGMISEAAGPQENQDSA